ncbi:MAG TPA: outer membrane protein assembly factor BamC [Burkholderiales bacterium]|jgi:outer membrane protein assembly factor BamC|nr:outer membrane protein assembly factor BamC [Burkholderiales bacterium]
MRSIKLSGFILAIIALLAFGGCSSLRQMTQGQKINYKSATELPSLEVPPDLATPTTDNHYMVPDTGGIGSATYSAYSRERQGTQPTASDEVLPTEANAHIQRDGDQRWLVVKEPPDKVWPVVKQFWMENGFVLKVDDPAAGVMETDWAENRANIPQGMVRNFLSKAFDSLYSTSTRDKFRTRLERGVKPGTTDIYISHTGMQEVFTNEDQSTTAWEPRKPDPGLVAIMLQKMLVRFGVSQERAKADIQEANATPEKPHAQLAQGNDGASVLTVDDPFDRAWRRVGLALDRTGFTVEDRDRSKGIYYVRYVDPDTETHSSGFLSKLEFWKSNTPQPKAKYQIIVTDLNNGNSRVEVVDKGGKVDGSSTSTKILKLLYEHLR